MSDFKKFDALVIGGGIAGMESSILLGDMGFKVLLVEKESSIGGKMILLSKVFPTLDCSSCISTPKMAATAAHNNITVLNYSEVEEIKKKEDSFTAKILKKASFVDPAKCTGCGQCELACTVPLLDQFNCDLVPRRAAYIAFPQAVPKKAVIERFGTSPCTFVCPIGIKAHGLVSLSRSGKFEEAYRLHLEDSPLVSTLSRICSAPCEKRCTRNQLEGSIPIRNIKRYIADKHFKNFPIPQKIEPKNLLDKKIAIIGSGPSGLSAAYYLAKKGYRVTIFESSDKLGGKLRLIPDYLLPKNLLDRDIEEITSFNNIEVKLNTKISSLKSLKENGFDAVLLSTGTSYNEKDLPEFLKQKNVIDAIKFLQNKDIPPTLNSKNVVVIGGNNIAMHCARVALRYKANVSIHFEKDRVSMSATKKEIDDATNEGARLILNSKLDEIDKADIIVYAMDPKPEQIIFDESDSNISELKVNEFYQTQIPWAFSCGDSVHGHSNILKAISSAKKAAFYLDLFLNNLDFSSEKFDNRLPAVKPNEIKERYNSDFPKHIKFEPHLKTKELNFEEIEQTISEEEVKKYATGCLDCGGCSECHQCVNICPANAIDFSIRDIRYEIEVDTVIVSTGFNLFNASKKEIFGFGRFPNVIDAMQMDRILAPTRPYNAVIRPSDGKVPSNIAMILCVGSRDRKVNNNICSRVCCMYSLKQAQLIMGALPTADLTIYYIDIRAFGKGYEEFYHQAKEMGIRFVKGKVARIEEDEENNLNLFYEDIEEDGQIKVASHDMVILSVGLLSNTSIFKSFKDIKLDADNHMFVREVEENIEPAKTSIEGIFVAGTSSSIKDIPDSVVHAGAAAAQAAGYITKMRRGL
ncbi:heterodisulfide reductase subunit A [Thermodesulfobium acidiphilum]|uniref:Heterodisulfide reductase subunit A n=1 Tax=Thermodesulfobium acidiphilum TaxID=1794699 RepID=A0A2R4VZ59_THEAF|nr:FAD-dependent oxidoreductase [Thermodesulfobium acidiphilum]AWB09817.1 heterodisulfide reductase subunit A [Thermodesulfobium acidiphilum]